MASVRTPDLGPAARPVAIPGDFGKSISGRAQGVVELPPHIRWSGDPMRYDLSDRADRARVYEQVLREGTEEDVRFYVDPVHLKELWADLVLPPAVRQAWTAWFRHNATDAPGC